MMIRLTTQRDWEQLLCFCTWYRKSSFSLILLGTFNPEKIPGIVSFLSFVHFNAMCIFYLRVCLHTTGMQCPQRLEEGDNYHRTGVMGGYQLSHGCWSQNPGRLSTRAPSAINPLSQLPSSRNLKLYFHKHVLFYTTHIFYRTHNIWKTVHQNKRKFLFTDPK